MSVVLKSQRFIDLLPHTFELSPSVELRYLGKRLGQQQDNTEDAR